MEFVGWYTNGDTPTAADANFHEQVCVYVVCVWNVGTV